LRQSVARKEAELLALYQQKHETIVSRNRRLHDLVFNAGHWWLRAPGLAGALRQVQVFVDNIERNFGEHAPAWRQNPVSRASRATQTADSSRP